MTTRRSFLRSLGLLAAAPFVAAHIRFAQPVLPNRGDPVPIIQTDFFRMADGSLIMVCPTEPHLYLVETADGRFHGGRCTWDPVALAFKPDRDLPPDRVTIQYPEHPLYVLPTTLLPS